MKKKIIIIISFIISILLMTACTSKYEEIKSRDNSKVLATVENEKITENEIEMAKMFSIFSEDEILENKVDEKLLLLYCKEQKISVTDSEVQNQLDMQKNFYKQLKDTDEETYNKAMEQLNSYLEKMAMTEDEYWNSFAPQGLKEGLIINKAKQQLGSKVYDVLKELRIKYEVKYF